MGSLTVTAIAIAVAAVGTLIASHRFARKRVPSSASLQSSTIDSPNSLGQLLEATPFSMRGFTLGDVVMLRTSEAWLTSALQIQDGDEDEAAVFLSDRTAEQDVLVVQAYPQKAVFHMHRVMLAEMPATPFTIEHEQEAFVRTRLVFVKIKHHGRGCPAVGTEGSWSWFKSETGRMLCYVHTNTGTAAWCGEHVDNASMLHMAAGMATLRD